MMPSQFFSLTAPASVGGVSLSPSDHFSRAASKEGTNSDWCVVSRMADTKSAVVAEDNKYAERAN